MENSEKVLNSFKLGGKRNFDVAFLSGENEKSKKVKDDQIFSAFSRYSKGGELFPSEADAIIGNQIPREAKKNDKVPAMTSAKVQSELKELFRANSSAAALSPGYPLGLTDPRLDQLSSLKKLLDPSQIAPPDKPEILPTPKVPLLPPLLSQTALNPLSASAFLPGPMAMTAFSPAASNTCAKCGITFRMTSDLVYHMRTHHTRVAEAQREAVSFENRRHLDRLKCPVCGENFRERHHLTRHMTAHQDKSDESREKLNV